MWTILVLNACEVNPGPALYAMQAKPDNRRSLKNNVEESCR
ncbi:hypothetical protein BH24PSE2_BH24PSE2_00560 [soil metagenome]